MAISKCLHHSPVNAGQIPWDGPFNLLMVKLMNTYMFLEHEDKLLF
ncbi:hypothetical protein NC651_012804 [Populus alba x Populus x berolinensis]|nr:hypothetical protein NC651_012804 [Populus alba x Populus x berolinensis]